jgi:hypothetical protein
MEPEDKGPVPAQPKPEKPTEPTHTGGGFGEFAEAYRARWAAGHPNMRGREWSGNAPSGTAPPPTGTPAEPETHSNDATTPAKPADAK